MPREIVKRLFWISLAVAVATLAALAVIDGHLKGPASPSGIVSFEFCAYRHSCGAILEGWGPDAGLHAALSLGLDYLFLVAYSAAICLGLLLVSAHVPESLQQFTTRTAWVPWVAGACDAAENFCLARMLVRPEAQEYAWPAAAFATVKFAVIGITLGWLLVATLRYVPWRRTTQESGS